MYQKRKPPFLYSVVKRIKNVTFMLISVTLMSSALSAFILNTVGGSQLPLDINQC